MKKDINCLQERGIVETRDKKFFYNGETVIPNSAFVLYDSDKDEKFFKSIYIQKLMSKPAIFFYGNCNNPEHKGCKYKIEEFKGIDLVSFLEMNFTITEKIILHIFYSISKELEKLHLLHIVHGDLKLENVIIKIEEKKIVDIQLIDYDESFVDKCHKNPHTPNVLTHEEYNNKEYSHVETTFSDPLDANNSSKMDIYGLGLILLYLHVFKNNKTKLPKFWNNPKLSSSCCYDKKKPDSFTKIVTFIDNNEQLIDLLKHMLCENFQDRYSIKNVLNHPYLSFFK